MQKPTKSFSEGEGRYQVRCDLSFIGSDLNITVYGGDQPHIGAVAVGIPRPSLADSDKISASVSVFTLTGHKEDELAKAMTEKITAASNRVTVLTAGIHIDNITPAEIKNFEKNANQVLNNLIAYLKMKHE